MGLKKITEEEIIQNLERCPHFETCSQNLCPLDLVLHLRVGGKADKCRWMREKRKIRISGKEFTSGGGVMPNAPLNFVPRRNLKWLNTPSQKKWSEIHNFKI